MLICKYFSRSHQACLIAVIDCDQHTHQSDKGLTATDIALKQPVHLFTRPQIPADLLHYLLLRSCKGKRKVIIVKAVKEIPDTRKNESLVLTVSVGLVSYKIQLDIEQLLKLQTIPRFFNFRLI